jgi:hypothetical protein
MRTRGWRQLEQALRLLSTRNIGLSGLTQATAALKRIQADVTT